MRAMACEYTPICVCVTMYDNLATFVAHSHTDSYCHRPPLPFRLFQAFHRKTSPCLVRFPFLLTTSYMCRTKYGLWANNIIPATFEEEKKMLCKIFRELLAIFFAYFPFRQCKWKREKYFSNIFTAFFSLSPTLLFPESLYRRPYLMLFESSFCMVSKNVSSIESGRWQPLYIYGIRDPEKNAVRLNFCCCVGYRLRASAAWVEKWPETNHFEIYRKSH